jgi:glutathione S-transferase
MLILYHHGSSVCAAKVRIVLGEKKMRWEGRYVDILKGEQFAPEFRKLNPKSVVPVLVDRDKVVTESTVICEYLEETHPDQPVFPADPYLRAQTRVWTKVVDEVLHPACGALTFIASHRHTVLNLGPEKAEEFMNSTPDLSVTSEWKERKRQYILRGFDAPDAVSMVRIYDKIMQKLDETLTGKEWLIGNTYSIADMSMVPYVNRLEMLGLAGIWERGRLPNLERWFTDVRKRPSFQEQVLSWIPESLERDLRTNGPKSWPDVSRILGITN